MRRWLARITVLLLLIGAVGVPAPVAPVPIADPYTFTSADVGFIDGGDLESRPGRIAAMDEYVGNKKPIIRVDLYWHEVQPSRHVAPNWTRLDGVVDAAYERGVRVLLILDYSAPWANGGRGIHYFPTEDMAWAGIVRQAVAHFGNKVQAYEVWNEPNLRHFGNYGDNSLDVRAGRYWQLVEIAHREVKAGCPQCVVLAGGSTSGDTYEDANGTWHGGDEAADWLEWAYRNGMGGHMDAVAYHPYPDHPGGNLPSFAKDPCAGAGHWYRFWSTFGPDDPECGGLAALRAVMVRYDDADKQIWGTEMGFPSDGWREPQTPERVRDALEEGIRMWRSRPYTGPLFIYSFQDLPTTYSNCVDRPYESECHFGLRDADGNPKEPMYSDVRAALIGDDWLPTLPPGRSLFRGAAMRSANGKFTLQMQDDGNLVLYDLRGGVPAPIWVRGDQRGYRLTHQRDGNVVLFDHAARPLWAASSWGRGASTMRLQDDGALVLMPQNADQGEPTWNSSDVFASGVEPYQPGNTWASTVSDQAVAGWISNVGGICCSLTGPELTTSFLGKNAHTGDNALLFSGNDTSTTTSFAYTKVFDLDNVIVTPTSRLSYWIYPQRSEGATGANSTCVAVDLIFSTPPSGARNSLRESGATDQHGNRAHPEHQCGKLTLDTWNFVSVPLGAVAGGKQVVQVDVGYDQRANIGGYRGFIDDIRITR
ncbi:hypothetical protein [Actinoplanes sp. NPDC051859]|uniref:hypothetical protein n=1 Tax=Actinoplanes sp. NPDC051859 TaxID=3363909 RepID=UPI003799D3B4